MPVTLPRFLKIFSFKITIEWSDAILDKYAKDAYKAKLLWVLYFCSKELFKTLIKGLLYNN